MGYGTGVSCLLDFRLHGKRHVGGGDSTKYEKTASPSDYFGVRKLDQRQLFFPVSDN